MFALISIFISFTLPRSELHIGLTLGVSALQILFYITLHCIPNVMTEDRSA